MLEKYAELVDVMLESLLENSNRSVPVSCLVRYSGRGTQLSMAAGNPKPGPSYTSTQQSYPSNHNSQQGDGFVALPEASV